MEIIRGLETPPKHAGNDQEIFLGHFQIVKQIRYVSYLFPNCEMAHKHFLVVSKLLIIQISKTSSEKSFCT